MADTAISGARPELVLQLGHSDNVRSVVFTPDGRRLVSGAWDDTIKIWLREAAEEGSVSRSRWSLLHTLVPDDGVSVVTLSPGGGIIACGSGAVTEGREHGRITLWDLQTAEPLRHLDGHSRQVRSLCFSPNGATLGSGSWDGNGILWDVRIGAVQCTLPGEVMAFDAISFSCDGALVAAPLAGGTVRVWDARTGELMQRLEVEAGSAGCIDALAFSTRDPLLAIGTGTGAVFLWDTQTWTIRQTLKGCRSRVFAVAFAPDGETVAAADIDNVLCVWDVRRGKQRWRRCVQPREERRWTDLGAHGEAVAFSPDGAMLAVGTGTGEDSIRFFDARTGERTGILAGHRDAITAICFAPDGRTLAAGGMSDGTLRFWDTTTGELTRTVKRGRDAVWLVGYSPDGEEILTRGGTGWRGLKRWDARTDVSIGTLTDQRLNVCAAAYFPEGAVVAVGGSVQKNGEYLGRLQLRDARTGRCIRTFRGQSATVLTLAVSSDGLLLASGSGDWCESGEARLWEVATGRCLHTLTGHPNQVESVAFSPDGRLLATASVGHLGENAPVCSSDVRLWDVRTGDLVRALPDAENATSPVAFSPDGVLLATCGEGTKVKLWVPETGALRRTLAGHSRAILDLTFSPDGRRLATTSLDCTVKLWDPGSGKLLAAFMILPPAHPRGVSTEWITVTPSGHYVRSEGAERFIRWRVGQELFPAERFESEYRSAAEVCRALGG